jgi:hypothetical protein
MDYLNNPFSMGLSASDPDLQSGQAAGEDSMPIKLPTFMMASGCGDSEVRAW